MNYGNFGTETKSMFSRELTVDENRNVEKLYQSVCGNVAKIVAAKYKVGYMCAEDFSCSAMMYAIAGAMNKGRLATITKKDLQALALWKAKMLALDWLRKVAKLREELLGDNPFSGDESKGLECDPVIVRASVQAWRNRQFDTQWVGLVEKTIDAVREFLSENFTSKQAAIFWTRMIKQVSPTETSRIFHVSSDNVGVICHRVMKAWRTRGKKYIQQAA